MALRTVLLLAFATTPGLSSGTDVKSKGEPSFNLHGPLITAWRDVIGPADETSFLQVKKEENQNQPAQKKPTKKTHCYKGKDTKTGKDCKDAAKAPAKQPPAKSG